MSDINRRPAPFVLVSTGQGSLIVNRNDHVRTAEGYEFGVGWQIFRSSYFDPEDVRFCVELIKLRRQHFGDGVVALDCGANLGVYTLEMAKASDGWGRVIAIEAQERIFYSLAGNIAINNCFNASAIHGAVGPESGTLRIPVPNYFVPTSFGSLELKKSLDNEYIGQSIDYSEAALTPVRQMTIDEIATDRLDFIKMDIEGMEFEAIDGAQNTLERSKPIIYMETFKIDKERMSKQLSDLGYVNFENGINTLFIHESDPTRHNITR